ncbi:MAG: hypothetical protein RL685_7526 [Pseudomonadota bacterium]
MALQLDSSLAFRPNPGTAQRADALQPGGRAQPGDRAAPDPAASAAFARALEGAGRANPASPGAAARHVAAQRTPLSGGEAAEALKGAWQGLTGQPPSAQTLSVLVGQWAHETGRGSAMLNYNFGGIKGTGPTGASTVYRTREGSGASEIQIQDRFRAYDTAEQGASDYLSLLTRRYPDALQAAERGDPAGFVQALKSRGYFTGDEAAYTKSVSALARQALSTGFDALGAAGSSFSPRALASNSPLRALGGAAEPEVLAAPEAAGAAALRALMAPPSPLDAVGASPVDIDSLLLAARNLHSPEALTPGAWAHALSDEVTRVDLLISALQIGQLGEKEEG